MKNKTPISFPVNDGLLRAYESAKGFNPNEEYSVWLKSKSSSKWLLIALSVLLISLAGSIFALKGFRGQNAISHKSKEEGQMFMLMMPTMVIFLGSALISFNLFEKLLIRRKAYKKMKTFAQTYAEFLAAIEATDDEVGRWSEERIKRTCLNILQIESSKVDKMKTRRGKASRLEDFIEIYSHMINIGLRFESVDAYIREIRILTRPKPKVSKTKKNTNSKGNVVPFQPAA